MLEGHLLNERYMIKRTIGGGGMANVYLATDTILDRDVAIKVLRLEYANDEEFIARFDREAQAATSLSHPNIVNIYDVGEEKHILYMVMEYVEGLTLKEYIKLNGPVEVEKALDIMKQITSAIAHAHANNLVHRDIKPQNILMDDYGNVKVTDFGIAVAMSATSLTQTNAILGSVHYLSPEQARGGMATKKSDIYSLGIVLFELLTGRLPFSGESPVSIALKHLQAETPSIRRFNRNVPQSVENIVLQSTAKDPFHRFKTVYEMEEAIDTAFDPDKINEDVYRPPVEAGEETKAIPIITDDHLATDEDEDTIIHQGEAPTKSAKKTEKKKKPKKKKKRGRKWIMILLTLFVLLGAGIVALFVLPGLMQPDEVKIPDVTEMEYEDAKAELEELNFKTEKEETFSEEIDDGLVVKTDPKAERTVKENSHITIFVSEGKEKDEFANYVGREYSQVKQLLEDRGFDDISSEDVHTDKPVGEITKQLKPEAGSKVLPGESAVVFEVSAGPDLIDLDNLVGMHEADTEAYLEDQGLSINKKEESSKDIDEGHVIRHEPDAHSKVKKDSTVTVYISSGSEQDPPLNQSVTFTVPHTADDGSEQEVAIYIDDMEHDISEVYEKESISSDKEYTISLMIEQGKEAEYKVVRDGKVLINKTVPYGEED